jgi:hypothetical protein
MILAIERMRTKRSERSRGSELFAPSRYRTVLAIVQCSLSYSARYRTVPCSFSTASKYCPYELFLIPSANCSSCAALM